MDKNGYYLLKICDHYICTSRIDHGFADMTKNIREAKIFNYYDAMKLVDELSFHPEWIHI